MIQLRENRINIGKAAKASGVSGKMLRYYEGIGSMTAAERSVSRYSTRVITWKPAIVVAYRS